MDAVIHAERVDRGGGKRTYEAKLSSLPEGVFIEHDGRPWLVRARRLTPWTFGGYGPLVDLDPSTEVRVLTPESVVRTIRAGFKPGIHPGVGP